MMAVQRTTYLIDEKGKKRAVLLSMREFARLLNRLEELEDALDLGEAVKSSSSFRDYGEVREELRREGRF